MKQMDNLSVFQVAMLVSNAMLGVGLLTLPRTITAEIDSPDGWIVLIIDGIIAILFAFLVLYFFKKHQVKDIFQYTREGFGLWISKAVQLFIILYFMGVASFEAVAMSEMVRFFLLATTPVQVVILSLMCLSAYLVLGMLQSITKVFSVFLPLAIVELFLIYFFSIKSINIENIKPLLGDGFSPIFKGLNSVILSFIGVEIFLVISAFSKNRQNLKKGLMIGFAIPLILYITTYVLVVSGLSEQEVKAVTWPTISFVQSFEVRGIFIERFESFLLTTWILQFFTTTSMYYYLAAYGMTQVFKTTFKTNVLILLPLLFLLACVPNNTLEIIQMSTIVGKMFQIVFFVIPIATFLTVALKRKLIKP